jgi:uncharacterized phage-associated protein
MHTIHQRPQLKKNKIKILPQHIVNQIKEKRKLRSLYIKEKKREQKTEINKLTEKIKTEIEKFEEQKWENLCNQSKNDHQSLNRVWKKIKKTSASTNNSLINITIEGIENPTDQEKSNHFAETLKSTF